MKLRKRLLLASSVAILLAPLSNALAQTETSEWKARSVSEIKADLRHHEENETTYTIKFGDTLSAIAEAMDIEVELLGNLNDITNLDLIYPDTVLTTRYNENKVAESLKIETVNENEESSLVAEVNLVAEEIVINDEVISYSNQVLPTVETPNETLITEKVSEWVSEPVAESRSVVTPIEETSVTEWIAPAVVTESSVVVTEVVEDATNEEMIVEEFETELENVEVPEDVVEDTSLVSEWGAPVVVEETTALNETILNEEAAVEEVTEEVYTEPVYEEETTELIEPVYEEETTEYVEPKIETYDDPANAGLQPQTIAFKNEVSSMFGGILGYSLYRPGDSGDHGKGLAVDFMVAVSSAEGDAIAEYAASQVATGRVNYVIWKQRIYGSWTGGQWQLMEDRGSVTENHFDHVHVSMN